MLEASCSFKQMRKLSSVEIFHFVWRFHRITLNYSVQSQFNVYNLLHCCRYFLIFPKFRIYSAFLAFASLSTSTHVLNLNDFFAFSFFFYKKRYGKHIINGKWFFMQDDFHFFFFRNYIHLVYISTTYE